MTLTDFLAARLDEDEAAAKDAYYEGQRWLAEEEGVYRYPDDELIRMADRKRDADHIVRWQPARVLREVEAKRQILAAYVAAEQAMREGDDTRWRVGEVYGLLGAVQVLSSAYSDHADYAAAVSG